MRTDIEIVKGDNGFDLFFVLQNYEGNVLSLNTVSNVYLKVQKSGEEALAFVGNMEVIDGSNGEVKYAVEQSNFEEEGRYYAEIEINFNNGQIITYDDILIKVKSDLPKEI